MIEPLYKNKTWLVNEYIDNRQSYAKIASICSVDVSTISWWIRHFDIKPRSYSQSTKFGHMNDEELLAKYKSGMTIRDIANECNMSVTAVHRHLHKEEIVVRLVGEQNRKLVDMEHAIRRNKQDLILLPELALEMNMNIKTLVSAFKRANVKPILFTDLLLLKFPILTAEWLRSKYVEEKLPMWCIAMEVGTHESNIKRLLKKHGIPLRHHTAYGNISGTHKKFLIPLLESAGIRHVTSHLLPKLPRQLGHGYEIDEYLPDHKIFLEVYGDYWHGKNLKVMEADKRKTSLLKEYYPDHNQMIIWEHELKNGSAKDKISTLLIS